MTKKEITGGTAHEMPADLGEALLANKDAFLKWESLTPLARNEWLCWVTSVTYPETRKKHIERTVAELLEGKRRPCCWYGCFHRTDKPVSPSVQKLVLDKKSKS